MCPLVAVQIHTSVHAGGIARSLIRCNVAASVTRVPAASTYAKPRPRFTRRIPGSAQSTRRSLGIAEVSDLSLDVHRAFLGAEATEVGADVVRDRTGLVVRACAFVGLDDASDLLFRVDGVGLVRVFALVGPGRRRPLEQVRLLTAEPQVQRLAGLLLRSGRAVVVDGHRRVTGHDHVVLRVAGDPLAREAGLWRGEPPPLEGVGGARNRAGPELVLPLAGVTGTGPGRWGSLSWSPRGSRWTTACLAVPTKLVACA